MTADPQVGRRQKEHCVKDVRDALYVARNTDGKLVRRPISPHLQIWRWPISMALSIGHRVTGVGLAIGTLLLTWWLVAAASSDNAFEAIQWFLGSPIGMLMLLAWTVSLVFHLFTGIRHLAWDIGFGFEPATYRLTARIVLIATAVLTLLIWFVGLAVW
jgi:succinate dehydrogenase / fumarate reductase, cytochrome b subunit